MRNYFLSCLVFNDWIISWNYFKTEVSNQIFVDKEIFSVGSLHLDCYNWNTIKAICVCILGYTEWDQKIIILGIPESQIYSDCS